jgi:hypothetical protein
MIRLAAGAAAVAAADLWLVVICWRRRTVLGGAAGTSCSRNGRARLAPRVADVAQLVEHFTRNEIPAVCRVFMAKPGAAVGACRPRNGRSKGSRHGSLTGNAPCSAGRSTLQACCAFCCLQSCVAGHATFKGARKTKIPAYIWNFPKSVSRITLVASLAYGCRGSWEILADSSNAQPRRPTRRR